MKLFFWIWMNDPDMRREIRILFHYIIEFIFYSRLVVNLIMVVDLICDCPMLIKVMSTTMPILWVSYHPYLVVGRKVHLRCRKKSKNPRKRRTDGHGNPDKKAKPVGLAKKSFCWGRMAELLN